MNKVLGAFVALLLTCLSTQAKSSRGISDYIARDAMAVLRVNDLNKLNQEVFAIGGMPMDLSSMVLMQLGNFSGNGFDKTRPVGAVLTAIKPIPNVYFIIPVTDAKLFQESCELPENASMQDEGQHVLVTMQGKLPLSFDTKLNANSKSLVSLTVDAQKMIQAHQTDIIGGLSAGRLQLSKGMNQGAAASGIDATTLSQITNTYFDIAQEFIFAMNTIQIDVDSTKGLVKLTSQADFKSTTTFAKFCNGQKNSKLIDASKINDGMMQFSGTMDYSKALEAFKPFTDKLLSQMTDPKLKDFLKTSLNDWNKIGLVEGAGALNMKSLTEMDMSGFAKALTGSIDWKALTRKNQDNPLMKELTATLEQSYKENVDQVEGKSIDALSQKVKNTFDGSEIEQNFYYLFDKKAMYFTMNSAYKESFSQMLKQQTAYSQNKGLVYYTLDYSKFNMMPIPVKATAVVSVKENGIVSTTEMNLHNIMRKIQEFSSQYQQ